ncbi:hypothetical protein [Blastopirellula marina]|uniref:Uncharacterized protein n=1 Tax=Blastopirellula marina TaxID=124 RepID=A0A2S8G1T6_9BACT|nr:hypothetical protein [Blastopirellula marina]PQO38094.1 hypothetical protein C5Y98_08400 [Blastopirellula marina]PTL44750.1 hypothetical protein C5Y97_08400 [Blastopirellula marina]
MIRRLIQYCLVLGVTACPLKLAEAQVVVNNDNQRPFVYSLSPHMEVGLVFGQAELIRAQGEAAVDYQTARAIAADAYDQELDNALKTVDIYFKRRELRDAKVLKDHLDEADKKKVRALRRLVDHPELTGEGLTNGRALNTMKEALRSSVLSFAYLNDDYEVADLMSRLQLTPEDLARINLKLTNVRGETGTFRADTGQLSTFQWWPQLLRDERFQEEREAIEANLAAIRQATSQQTEIDPALTAKLESSILALANKFLGEVDGQAMARKGVQDYYIYRESEVHLQSLSHAARRLKQVGKADGALIMNSYNPSVDGKNLTSLLSYMVRNGVEFAPPEPGNESTYNKLFEMAKSLYVSTSGEDGSL